MDTNFISASEAPQLANQLAEKAMSGESNSPQRAPILLPPDPSVSLPGGFLDPIVGLITTAEVRELTGADEEAIVKTNNIGKALLLILDRATISLGSSTPPEPGMLDMLLSGDREAIILKIRLLTFGSEVKLRGNCPSCGENNSWKIDLVEDVETKELKGSTEFLVKCKVGDVLVTLPTGNTQKEIINSTNRTSAEIDTIILKNCIRSINGSPILGAEAVRSLGIKDRRDILQEIEDRNPGPQLGDIKKACTACGTEVPLPLTLAELF